jgi:hypothetical protein
MELHDDMGQVESHFGPFGDSVHLGTRWVHGLRANVPCACKCFWSHPMELLSDVGEVEARFSLLVEGVNLNAK